MLTTWTSGCDDEDKLDDDELEEDPELPVDGVGDPERAERRLERGPQPLDRGAYDPDPLRRRVRA